MEACKKEGIDPTYILYRPLESFANVGKPEEIQTLEHDQADEQRQSIVLQKIRKDMLIQLRNDRWEIIKRDRRKAKYEAELQQPDSKKDEKTNMAPQLKYHYKIFSKVWLYNN